MAAPFALPRLQQLSESSNVVCKQLFVCLHSRSVGMQTASLRATSVGVNQVAVCIDWGPQGLVAYGAHNQVVLYDVQVISRFLGFVVHETGRSRNRALKLPVALQDASVVATLRGHNDRVNCVKWLPDEGEARPLVLSFHHTSRNDDESVTFPTALTTTAPHSVCSQMHLCGMGFPCKPDSMQQHCAR